MAVSFRYQVHVSIRECDPFVVPVVVRDMVSLTSAWRVIVHTRTVPLSTFKFNLDISAYYLSSTGGKSTAHLTSRVHRPLRPGILSPLFGISRRRRHIFCQSRVAALALLVGAVVAVLLFAAVGHLLRITFA